MAGGTENLPDLWALAKQMMQRLRDLLRRRSPRSPRESSAASATASLATGSQPQPITTAQNAREIDANRNRPVAGWRSTATSETAQKQQKTTVTETIASRLRNRHYLRQAIVVNELIGKPLALRRRRRRLF